MTLLGKMTENVVLTGKRHRYFSKEEWVTQCTNGMLCLEDGVVCDPEEFWRWRQGPEWDDGWEIIPNPERSVG